MRDEKFWSKTESEKLIAEYEQFPVLWDPCHPDYNERTQRNNAQNILAEKFNTTKKEVSRKLHNLRNQFFSEIKRTQMKNSDPDTTKKYISKWFHFPSLKFLEPSWALRGNIRDFDLTHCPMDYVECTNTSESMPESEINKNDNEIVPAEINENANGIVPAKLLKKKSKKNNKPTNKTISPTKEMTFTIPFPFQDKKSAKQSDHQDEYDIFGLYVASEFRSMPNDFLKRKFKRKIQEVILDMGREMDVLYDSKGTSSNRPQRERTISIEDEKTSNKREVMNEDLDSFKDAELIIKDELH